MGNCFQPEEVDEPAERRPLTGGSTRDYQNTDNVDGAPTDKKWYHGQISNDEADYRLQMGANGNEGSYIVYDNPLVRGDYILLVYHRRKLLRWKIKRTKDGMYILGRNAPGVVKYKTVRELVKAHRGVTGKPIKLQNGGVLTLSKSYVYVA